MINNNNTSRFNSKVSVCNIIAPAYNSIKGAEGNNNNKLVIFGY